MYWWHMTAVQQLENSIYFKSLKQVLGKFTEIGIYENLYRLLPRK